MTPKRMAALVARLRSVRTAWQPATLDEDAQVYWMRRTPEVAEIAAAALEVLARHADAEDWGEAQDADPVFHPVWTGEGVPREAFEAVLVQHAILLADALDVKEEG